VRNLLFVLAMCLPVSATLFHGNPFSLMEFSMLVGILLSLIYFNTYVLLPRFLFKNRLIEYVAAIVLVVILLFVMFLHSNFGSETTGIVVLSSISYIVQIAFMFVGPTAFVIFQHWARNERYIARLEAATMRAELEQLQNQINPHFLFNMLNNILVLIRETPKEAVVILHKMSDMLKYQFNVSTKKEVLLKDDIHFLTDFLNLEKISRDRFEFSVSIDNDIDDVPVPPLIFIPFVENAVKHSADAVNLTYIRLNFKTTDNMLHFTCVNSKPLQPSGKNEFSGLGLTNIKRRLELLYNENHALSVHEDETSYTVQLTFSIQNRKSKIVNLKS
jgi:sensor histidine kinase YesM